MTFERSISLVWVKELLSLERSKDCEVNAAMNWFTKIRITNKMQEYHIRGLIRECSQLQYDGQSYAGRL